MAADKNHRFLLCRPVEKLKLYTGQPVRQAGFRHGRFRVIRPDGLMTDSVDFIQQNVSPTCHFN
jgi:hypothetical protein